MKLCRSITTAKYQIDVPVYATAANLCGIVRKFLRAWWRREPACLLTFGSDTPTDICRRSDDMAVTWRPEPVGIYLGNSTGTIDIRDNYIVDAPGEAKPE